MKKNNKKDFLVALTILIMSVLFVRCSSQDAGGVNDESSEGTLTEIDRLVTAGAGINFNGAVGGFNIMRLHPTTLLPGIVYHDKSAAVSGQIATGALKYAYMDSNGVWNIEVIDASYGTTACPNAAGFCVGAQNLAITVNAQFFDFKYTAGVSGTVKPVVAYAFGNSTATGKRIRYAERNMTTGLWEITDAVPTTSIPAGIAVASIEFPIKGLNLVLDSLDRPHITTGVYTTTYTNSQIMYTMRKSSGSWTTFSNVTAAGFTFVGGGTIGAATGMNQSGSALCSDGKIVLSVASADNSPATSHQPWILRCMTYDADGACATWQAFDMITGCGAACFSGSAMTAATTNSGQRTDLTIDPATNKIIFGSYSVVVPTTQLNTAIQPAADTCATTNFAASVWTHRSHTSTLAGASGFRLAASSTNSFVNFIASTTSAAMASTSASLGAAWTASSTSVLETSTVMDSVGTAYDSTNDIMWMTYGTVITATTGQVGSDLKVAATYASDIASGAATAIGFVDQMQAVVTPSTTALPVMDAAKASNGTIGYAYFFQEGTATGAVNSKLYYGTRNNEDPEKPTFASNIVFNSVQGTGASAFVGTYPALTYDPQSNPVITFLDGGVTAPSNTGALMMARSPNGGSSFSVDKVDGTGTTITVGRHSSVDVTSGNVVGISYQDFTATNMRLKFARKLNGGAWRKYVVEGLLGSAAGCMATTDSGSYSKFKWTSTGRPVILFQSTVGGIKYLRMAYATEATSSSTYTWTCLTLDSTGQGANNRADGIDFVLDSSDKPHIVHMDSTQGSIRYVTCSDSVLTCAATGASAFTAERISLTGTVTPASHRPSIKVDSSGKRWVSFYSFADQGLYIATKGVSDTSWDMDQVTDSPSGILFPNQAGQYGVLLLNSSGYPSVFYRSYENWIKYYSQELL